jgi:hypothetical protein
LLIAVLFCGFLSEGNPSKNLASAIIIIFLIDIIGCFVLGLLFQIYLINLKFKKNREVTVVTPTAENISEHDKNPKN